MGDNTSQFGYERPPLPHFYTDHEVAEALQISIGTLRQYLAISRQFHRIGREKRLSAEQVERIIGYFKEAARTGSDDHMHGSTMPDFTSARGRSDTEELLAMLRVSEDKRRKGRRSK